MSAYFSSTFQVHQNTPTDQIIGTITLSYGNQHLDLKQQQTKSWHDIVEIFKQFFHNNSTTIDNLSNWEILYEYKIPRRAKRIDVVLLSGRLIFVIEVKSKQIVYKSADKAQLEDYCLDLRDFHFESKGRIIIPILLCTDAPEEKVDISINTDQVQNVIMANRNNISRVISIANSSYKNLSTEFKIDDWVKSKYFPTPTIIEAAQQLYSKQSVNEISRNQAGIENLKKTTKTVTDAIIKAWETKSKIICFITGVPGAGKTLAGLNIVHSIENRNTEAGLGVFLSGNSPLIKVLSEALARDSAIRNKQNLSEARRRVKTFIHNVHEFIEEYYFDKTKLPVDKVLVYDEAQRAWTKEYKSKKSNGTIKESEPEILLSIMNRFNDWAVIIALVGGGQEINTGEAGLREWGKAIETKFCNWEVYISPELKLGDHSTGNQSLFLNVQNGVSIIEDENLHLRASIRSFKGEDLSQWVTYVLDNKPEDAELLMKNKLREYPVFITRDLEKAKLLLKSKARGTRRIGLIASSGGRRLKAIGYDPYFGLRGDSTQNDLGVWYLNPASDVRSSNFLEILATEYAIQGLEIDWAGILWDTDLRRGKNNWVFKQFRGTIWQNVQNELKKQYILNKYRVLLTRAREGMIIYVPYGDENDATRAINFYDNIYDYLRKCGIKEVLSI